MSDDIKSPAEIEALVLKYKAEAAKFEAEALQARTAAAQSACALEDQQIDLRHAAKDLRRPVGVARTENAVALMLQKRPRQQTNIRIVIHQQNHAWG